MFPHGPCRLGYFAFKVFLFCCFTALCKIRFNVAFLILINRKRACNFHDQCFLAELQWRDSNKKRKCGTKRAATLEAWFCWLRLLQPHVAVVFTELWNSFLHGNRTVDFCPHHLIYIGIAVRRDLVVATRCEDCFKTWQNDKLCESFHSSLYNLSGLE